MTTRAIKQSLDQLSSNVSARLDAIASQRRDAKVASLVREAERQKPDAQIVVSETQSGCHIDVLSDDYDGPELASLNDADETRIATVVANIIEFS